MSPVFSKIDFTVICWLIFVLVWIISAFWVKPSKERQSRKSRLAALVFLAIIFLLLSGSVGIHKLNAPIFRVMAASRFTGDAFTLVGLFIAIWARLCLGRNWSGTVSFKQDHELIEHGPYRFVRHPIYTGMLLMVLGTAVSSGRLSALLALVFFSFGIWKKLRREETLLTKYFPDAYPRYMSHTKALIPFVL